EVANQFLNSLNEVETGAKTADQAIKDGMARMKLWFNKEIVEDLKATLSEVDQSADSAASIIEKEFAELHNWFNKDIVSGVSEILGNVEEEVGKSSKAVVDGFSELRDKLEKEVVNTATDTMAKVENKVGSASEMMTSSIENMRRTHSEKVVESLRKMLEDVENRVSRSQETMYSLWERAKSLVTFRFQDVWFVLGREGARAQINETLAKAKARALIVAPELKDIDAVPILNLKPHVAIRISTFIDPTDPKSADVLSQLSARENLELRNYPDKNIWGIARENEEVFIGAVSELGDIAGIASVVGEHQKMFVPILEDAWLKGRKVVITKTTPKVIPTTPVTEPVKVDKVSEEEKIKSLGDVSATSIAEIMKPVYEVVENGIVGPIHDALEKAKTDIALKFKWHVCIYEMGNWIRKLKKEKLTEHLDPDRRNRLLKKLDDWSDRLKQVKPLAS
ncbi:MAG: hypothetical protein ACFFCM_15570, partial [Promethearchaeota archaeon]